MNLKSNFRFLLTKHSITRHQLVKEAGTSNHSVFDTYHGKGNPTLSTLLKWCDYFGVTLDQLVLHDLTQERGDEHD